MLVNMPDGERYLRMTTNACKVIFCVVGVDNGGRGAGAYLMILIFAPFLSDTYLGIIIYLIYVMHHRITFTVYR